MAAGLTLSEQHACKRPWGRESHLMGSEVYVVRLGSSPDASCLQQSCARVEVPLH